MRRTVFISSPALWQTGFGRRHPLKPERLERTVALLQAYHAFDLANVELVEPRQATVEELALFHSPEYIDAVRRLSEGATDIPQGYYGFGPGDNPVFPGMYTSAGLKAGGAIQGAEHLIAGTCDVAFNFSGGLHHARPAQASGFCIFNDVAVAIQRLRRADYRVAYIDIDAHHGDGVQAAFYDTDQVLTISLHQDGHTLFPGSGFVDEIGVDGGLGYSVNVPLRPRTDDETYLWAFREIVPPLIERFNPDVLVTQLGVDTHYQDPLTHMGLTTAAHLELFRELAALSPARWLAFGGGGYNLDVVPRAWTLAFSVMAEQTFANELPAAYRERYGGRRLNDDGGPVLHQAAWEKVRQHAEDVVATLKAEHPLLKRSP